jgi:uncharacterized lipoprotein YmbA
MKNHSAPNLIRLMPFAAVGLLAGCLARPHLDKQSFIFAPASLSGPGAVPGSRVLGIRTLQVAPPFEGRGFVYRTGEFSYDRDPYAQFMVSPAEALVSPICARLRQAGPFSAVVEAGSALKPDTLVEIHVDQLYGDFQQPDHATAVLAMRFAFIDSSNGVPARALLQKGYSRDIPLKAPTAAALIEGWNQGLAQILDSALLDFGRAGANAPRP